MNNLDKLCNKTARDLKEDKDVVHKLVMFQFKQILERMRDLDDTRDILLNRLFKFKLKTRYKNNKHLKYTAHGTAE